MLIGRGTRRAIGIVTLVAMTGFLGLTAFAAPVRGLWTAFGNLRWPLFAMIVIVLVSNGYRFLWRRDEPKPPAAKPRPTHLKLVRTDETLH